jgi:di/tricarboxylate transporter
MTWSILLLILILSAMMTGLILEIKPPEIILFLTLITLLLSGMITVKEIIQGFANETIVMVGILFFIGGFIQKSNFINTIFQKMVKISPNNKMTLLKMLLPISTISSFLNNTPIVVTLTPVIHSWCQNNKLAPSKFLIPLSYATILGGTITIMGTSTNLVIYEMLVDQKLTKSFMFELGIVGISITITGIAYLIFIGQHLLPSHKENIISNPKRNHKFALFQLLFIIGCSFGIGTAVTNSGAAYWIAQSITHLTKPYGVFVLLIVIYLLTNIFTEFMSNNAVALMMLPIAIEVAQQAQVNPAGLAVIVAIASSCGFSIPTGYQTHMIVYEPGGYSFKDFLKIGFPLNIMTMFITVMIIYFFQT